MICLTGLSAPAANSESGVSSSSQAATQNTIVNSFSHCQLNLQQGNHNNMMETSEPAVQETFDAEVQNSELDSVYDVTEYTPDTEYDLHTFNELGVVRRSDHQMTGDDECSDDETSLKRVVCADELGTSPETDHLPDETNLSAHPQPLTSRAEYNDWSLGVVGSSVNETDATVNSREDIGASAHRQVAGLGAEDATEEDAVRKNLLLQPVASADNDDVYADADYNDEEQGPVSDDDDDRSLSAEAQADDAARLTESGELESVGQMEASTQRVMEDSNNLFSADSGFTDEVVSPTEQQTDISVLPTSLSIQQEAPVSSHLVDDESAGNNRSSVHLDQNTSTYWSWLPRAVFRAAQVYIYITRYTRV